MKILDKRVRQEEFERTTWVVTVESGVSREDVLEPDFWAYVAMKFKPYDRVELRTDDSAFFAEYLILSSDRVSAYLKELNYWDLKTKGKVSKDSLYVVRWMGPHGKWSVIRTSDSATLESKMGTEQAAMEWLTTYLKGNPDVNIPT